MATADQRQDFGAGWDRCQVCGKSILNRGCCECKERLCEYCFKNGEHVERCKFGTLWYGQECNLKSKDADERAQAVQQLLHQISSIPDYPKQVVEMNQHHLWQLLGDVDARVRSEALAILHRTVPPVCLASHAKDIRHLCMTDADAMVRAEALTALSAMNDMMRADDLEAIISSLDGSKSVAADAAKEALHPVFFNFNFSNRSLYSTQALVLKALGPTKTVLEHGLDILRQAAETEHVDLRVAAVRLLGKRHTEPQNHKIFRDCLLDTTPSVSKEMLLALRPLVVTLPGIAPDVRLAALKAINRDKKHILVDNDQFPTANEFLATQIMSEDKDICGEALRIVGSMGERRMITIVALADEADQTELQADQMELQALAAARVLKSLDDCWWYCSFTGQLTYFDIRTEVSHMLRLLMLSAARGPWLNVIQSLHHHRGRLLESKDQYGNRPLHLAASAGHWDACSTLLALGARVSTTNKSNKTAAQVAKESDQDACFQLLDGAKHFISQRGGSGDAWRVAKEDARPVTGVWWYTFPLAGFVGSVGGKHSLLAVKVGTERDEADYVLEKASCHDEEKDDIKNGVYISHWADVLLVLEDHAECKWELKKEDLVDTFNLNGADCKLTIASLREAAVNDGPYDAVTCNCHHAALKIYNLCAKEDKHIAEGSLPNGWLMKAADVLKRVGLDVCQSRGSVSSLCSQAPLAFRPSLCAPLGKGDFPIKGNCREHNFNRAWEAALLSQWVYHPRTESGFWVVNGMSESLQFNVKTGSCPIVKQGEMTFIACKDKVLVQVYHLGVLNLTSWRTRLFETEMSKGLVYTIKGDRQNPEWNSEDHKECLAFLPEGIVLQPDDLHYREGFNVVQWAAAASSDAVYVTFKGTGVAQEVVTDLCANSMPSTVDRLRVHQGMWVNLHQDRPGLENVTPLVAATISKLRNACPERKAVILCGHSLGGGYALLVALELLQQGVEDVEVLTFGAPQVVVPRTSSKAWQDLNRAATLYVNSYDMVPRLPTCWRWVLAQSQEAEPGIPGELAALAARCLAVPSLNSTLEKDEGFLAEYDVVGTMVLISNSCPEALQLPHSEDRAHLSELQRGSTSIVHLVGHHLMSAYKSALRNLVQLQDAR